MAATDFTVAVGPQMSRPIMGEEASQNGSPASLPSGSAPVTLPWGMFMVCESMPNA